MPALQVLNNLKGTLNVLHFCILAFYVIERKCKIKEKKIVKINIVFKFYTLPNINKINKPNPTQEFLLWKKANVQSSTNFEKLSSLIFKVVLPIFFNRVPRSFADSKKSVGIQIKCKLKTNREL